MNLILQRRFGPFFWTQFLGAFNDNVYKNALVLVITYKSVSLLGLSPEQMVAAAGGIFIFPYFLFSALAGQCADKFPKSKFMVWTKAWEIVVMCTGALGFALDNVILMLVSLFFMGLQSTFFSPAKYAVLPEILKPDELVAGNAFLQMGTFLAILMGTILGGVLVALPSGVSFIGATVISVAVVGWLASLIINPLPASNPSIRLNFEPFSQTWNILKMVTETRPLFLSILGISWFWFFGASLLALIPPYVKNTLLSSAEVASLFLAVFSIGVGVGSFLTEKLSFKIIELGLVPIGSFGISFFLLGLYFVGNPLADIQINGELLTASQILNHSGGWLIISLMFALSLFCGFFIIPLNTMIQQRSPAHIRSQVIASNNVLNALAMVISAVFLMWLYSVGCQPADIFIVLSLMNLAVAVYIYTVVPEFMFRFICWVMARGLYRLKVFGSEHIPADGAAVIVCNHVTFIDWLVISSASPRPIRFVMHHSFLKIPLSGRLFRDAKVIPIAGVHESKQVLTESFLKISEELRSGEIVCIFPEGSLTRDGEISEFKRGIERIIEADPVPVVPMAISGLWGSLFSREPSKNYLQPFRRLWSRIVLHIGPPIPPHQASAESLQVLVSKLRKKP